jgi:hypothetical protein
VENDHTVIEMSQQKVVENMLNDEVLRQLKLELLKQLKSELIDEIRTQVKAELAASLASINNVSQASVQLSWRLRDCSVAIVRSDVAQRIGTAAKFGSAQSD